MPATVNTPVDEIASAVALSVPVLEMAIRPPVVIFAPATPATDPAVNVPAVWVMDPLEIVSPPAADTVRILPAAPNVAVPPFTVIVAVVSVWVPTVLYVSAPDVMIVAPVTARVRLVASPTLRVPKPALLTVMLVIVGDVSTITV